MKVIGTIDGQMYVQASNRSPVMVINGNKRKSAEDEIRDILATELKVLLTHSPSWRKMQPNEVIITPSSGKTHGTGSISDILPHTKRVRITIEID